jgi:subtilisin family serine protease
MGNFATTRRLVAAGGLAMAALVASATVLPAAAEPVRRPQASSSLSTYIVTLDTGESPTAAAADDITSAEISTEARHQLDDHRPGARPGRVYRHALHGYTAQLTADQADALADDPGVAAVEPDVAIRAFDTQPNAPWSLDRVDQRDLPLSGSYTYGPNGAGVTAYVIDTGIRFSHQEFGGRAVSGFDAVDGGTADDCNGHGTHVSSTIGGGTYGVAKGVRLSAVRVLDCSGGGTGSGVIAGIDWVVANHQAGQPAVANFSLGGAATTALDQAIDRLINDGVTVVVASGNSGSDACGTSPARVPAAVTVAASTQSDALASFSNRGPCVDVIAPGGNITGAWAGGDTATRVVSGTSMASPHAAGAAAKHLQTTPGASPAAVSSALTQSATPDHVSGTAGSCMWWIFCTAATPNRLLFTN